jgi:hypothetical protein
MSFKEICNSLEIKGMYMLFVFMIVNFKILVDFLLDIRSLF